MTNILSYPGEKKPRTPSPEMRELVAQFLGEVDAAVDQLGRVDALYAQPTPSEAVATAEQVRPAVAPFRPQVTPFENPLLQMAREQVEQSYGAQDA